LISADDTYTSTTYKGTDKYREQYASGYDQVDEYKTDETYTDTTYDVTTKNKYDKKTPKYNNIVKCSIKYVKGKSPVYCSKNSYCVAVLPYKKYCTGSSPKDCPMEARCADAKGINF
jgi:hypothetical protein